MNLRIVEVFDGKPIELKDNEEIAGFSCWGGVIKPASMTNSKPTVDAWHYVYIIEKPSKKGVKLG